MRVFELVCESSRQLVPFQLGSLPLSTNAILYLHAAQQAFECGGFLKTSPCTSFQPVSWTFTSKGLTGFDNLSSAESSASMSLYFAMSPEIEFISSRPPKHGPSHRMCKTRHDAMFAAGSWLPFQTGRVPHCRVLLGVRHDSRRWLEAEFDQGTIISELIIENLRPCYTHQQTEIPKLHTYRFSNQQQSVFRPKVAGFPAQTCPLSLRSGPNQARHQ